jgi:hypothetical protein
VQNYQAYLLRVWRESAAEPWRATLEDPHTGERLGFGGVDGLLAYLIQCLATDATLPPAGAAPTGNSVLPPSEMN